MQKAIVSINYIPTNQDKTTCKGVDVGLNEDEDGLSIDELIERVFRPALAALFANIRRNAA